MPSIRLPENIGALTRTSSTTLTLAASVLNIGGQQYRSISNLTLNTGTVGAGGVDSALVAFSTYYVFAVISNSVLALIASTNSTAPSGFSNAKLVGNFTTDGTPSVAEVFSSDKYDEIVNSWAYNPPQNHLLNGNFDLFQRGTNRDPGGAGQYGPDRWAVFQSSGSVVVSRQTADLAGSSFYMRVTSNAANAFRGMTQPLELQAVDKLKGKWVTFGVNLRINALFNQGLVIGIDKNSTANTLTGGTWVALASKFIAPGTLSTTAWNRFWVTAFVPADTSANGLRVTVNVSSAVLNSGAVYEVSQAMLNVGSIAAPFRLQGDDVTAEEIKCQRFYCKTYPRDVTPGSIIFDGCLSWQPQNTGLAYHIHTQYYPVEMRAGPNLTFINPNNGISDNTSVFTNVVWDGNAATSRNFSIYLSSPRGFSGHHSPGSEPSNTMYMHYTAEAEIG